MIPNMNPTDSPSPYPSDFPSPYPTDFASPYPSDCYPSDCDSDSCPPLAPMPVVVDPFPSDIPGAYASICSSSKGSKAFNPMPTDFPTDAPSRISQVNSSLSYDSSAVVDQPSEVNTGHDQAGSGIYAAFLKEEAASEEVNTNIREELPNANLKETAATTSSTGIVKNRRQELKKRMETRRQELQKQLSDGNLRATEVKLPQRCDSAPSQIRQMAAAVSANKRDHPKRHNGARLNTIRMQVRRQELSHRMAARSKELFEEAVPSFPSAVPVREVDTTTDEEDSRSIQSDITADEEEFLVASCPLRERAAITIQHFFRNAMYYLDEVRFFELQLEDVERRRQEEVQDLQRQVELEKQQLRLQYHAECRRLEAQESYAKPMRSAQRCALRHHQDTKVKEWEAWSRAVDKEQRNVMALKDEADWLQNSIHKLSHAKTLLERDLRQQEQATQCLQDKVDGWEAEQVRLCQQLQGLEQEHEGILCQKHLGEIISMINERSEDPMLINEIGKIVPKRRATKDTNAEAGKKLSRTRALASSRIGGRSKSVRSLRAGRKSRSSSRPKISSPDDDAAIGSKHKRSKSMGFYSWETHLDRVNSAPSLPAAASQTASSKSKRRNKQRPPLKRNDSEPLRMDGEATARRRTKSKDKRKTLERNASVPVLLHPKGWEPAIPT